MRATDVESEMELAVGSLHQLGATRLERLEQCAPGLDRLEQCAASRREWSRTAFGSSGGSAPDRLLVGYKDAQVRHPVSARGSVTTGA